MANTFELIASSTVGASPVASIDFSSIPSTYTDLVVKVSIRSSRTASRDDTTIIKFNGSSTGYTAKYLVGTGSAAGSYSDTLIYGNTDSNLDTANTFGSAEFYIPNYASSAYKSVSSDSAEENNATAANAGFTAGLWSNTAAINQITLSFNGSNALQYSTAYLYGVKNA